MSSFYFWSPPPNSPIIPIIIIGAEHFLIVVIVTYMNSKSGDSDVLSLTFIFFKSFSKIIPF